MDEREILDHLLKSAHDDRKYFSRDNKAERERWVVAELLAILGVTYHEEELISLAESSKIDVQFRDASFQVKELTDPELRRDKMYKDAYKSILAAKRLEDVTLVGDAREIPPTSNMYELVVELASGLASNKYREVKSELDLLIYVTRTRASLIQRGEVDAELLSELGWRSISCVNAKQAVVLFASKAAPEFLRHRSGIVMSASG